MLKAVTVTALLVLAFGGSAVAQDDAPTTTVVPNDQFCNLVSDDLAACEQALTTLATAGLLPEAFAGLMTATAPAEVASTGAGEPVKVSGKGSKKTKPITLAEGDYEVRLKKAKGCDQFTYGYLTATDDGSSVSGEVSQDGYIYGVEEGRYYWDAEADDKCKWTYTLTPLE